MMDDAFKPKKRIFMALTSVSALIGAIMVGPRLGKYIKDSAGQSSRHPNRPRQGTGGGAAAGAAYQRRQNFA